MSVELNRTTFRRLVQLYLLSIVLTFAALIYEMVEPTYYAFSLDYDSLREGYFGKPSETQIYIAAALCVIGLITHLIGAIALLWFRPWARWLILASVLIGLPSVLIPIFYPYWIGFWTGWTSFLGSVLFGMILLLAFSREHGAIWFARSTDSLKEEFNG